MSLDVSHTLYGTGGEAHQDAQFFFPPLKPSIMTSDRSLQ